MGIEKLCDQDFIFLNEYVAVIRPIADAITFVESTRQFFGSYLPTLFGVRTRLRELYLEDKLLYCKPLLVAVKNGFDKRLEHLMKLSDLYDEGSPKAVPLYIAMLCNPAFKLSYIPVYWLEKNPNTISQIKSIFLNAMVKQLGMQTNGTNGNEDEYMAASSDTVTTSNQSGNHYSSS